MRLMKILNMNHINILTTKIEEVISVYTNGLYFLETGGGLFSFIP
jgi:hypothetical protein